MNYNYRIKPESIEAFQMTKERRFNNKDWPTWLNVAWNKDHHEVGSIFPSLWPASDGKDTLLINYAEGFSPVTIQWGDWIVHHRGAIDILSDEEFSVFCEPQQPVDEQKLSCLSETQTVGLNEAKFAVKAMIDINNQWLIDNRPPPHIAAGVIADSQRWNKVKGILETIK